MDTCRARVKRRPCRSCGGVGLLWHNCTPHPLLLMAAHWESNYEHPGITLNGKLPSCGGRHFKLRQSWVCFYKSNCCTYFSHLVLSKFNIFKIKTIQNYSIYFRFRLCLPQCLWCYFVGYPSSPATSHRFCVPTCQPSRPVQPVSFKGMRTGITISPGWAFITVAFCCPARTLPSVQTRLPWWTEAGLFTPCVKCLFGGDSLWSEEKKL